MKFSPVSDRAIAVLGGVWEAIGIWSSAHNPIGRGHITHIEHPALARYLFAYTCCGLPALAILLGVALGKRWAFWVWATYLGFELALDVLWAIRWHTLNVFIALAFALFLLAYCVARILSLRTEQPTV